MGLAIREAVPADVPTILRLIRNLADYEKLAHEAVATEDDIRRDLFGPQPRVFCSMADWAGRPVGFALWYYTFSTFQGRHGIWLEDVFVEPEARGQGIGKALLVHLAQRCVSEGLGRFEWAVLDWNQPSIDFYRSQGARPVSGWQRFRLDGMALAKLGAS
jgi:GNAT superfamily N-acetyltransferase